MLTKKFILNKIAQAGLHIAFWIGVLFFYTYLFGTDIKNFNDTLLFSYFLMPVTIAVTYVSIYKLIPDYLIKKRYALFVLYSVYAFIISLYLIMVSIFFSLIYLSNFEYSQMAPATKNTLFIVTAVYLVTFIVSAFKLLKLNLKNTEQNNALKTKILDTQLKLKEQELHYLKMQIHPHFLFNTLNTLYGFALKKADETPEMILKLSNLLDYLLYQADKPFVALSEEIEHIKDYITLEKMRFNDTLNVSFKSVLNDDNKTIAPMLLLPFVENSFKHGALQNGALTIAMNLESYANNIVFSITNSFKNEVKKPHGIGLDNIKKRLELVYPNKHQLHISNTNHIFKVELTLHQ
ncbi:histidine kinase [Tamlana nanhaiensis]|uniref:Histidine kinase n=1 Tax=Neotamlana nanhaiensis TaxID=1382798 RepID=A0A0D7W226_9FLAO|nr:histidine kinase [Tamlana nanhaiensis]KJD33104.1 histidine kinase [Tamlana nanhaiensis]